MLGPMEGTEPPEFMPSIMVADSGEDYVVPMHTVQKSMTVSTTQAVTQSITQTHQIVTPAKPPEIPMRKVSGFREVLESKEKLRFIIDNMLPHTGLMFIGGISGTGKTIMAIQTAVNIVLGRPTMSWMLAKDLEPVRCLFLSLEMGQHELQMRQIHMGYDRYSDEDLDYLQENMPIYREAEPFRLWEPDAAADLMRLIIRNKVNLVLIDSASVALADSLKDDIQVNKSLENLRMIRVRLEVAMIMVAHTRKPPTGNTYNPEDANINDLFGHSGVAQHASSIWILMEDQKQRAKTVKAGNGADVDKIVHFINVKNRFGASNAAFEAQLTSKTRNDAGEPLMFSRNVIALPPLTEEQKEKIKQMKPTTLSQSLGQIKFAKPVTGDDDE